ncbi:MAG TPA: M67 family metallopeptidase [Actinomycetota bacterium]
METFEIPESMVADMVAHADAEYPSECCGVIGGDSVPRRLFRLRNVDPDPVMRYSADPRELKRATDEIYDADWEILCIYHSHTHSPAFPSPTDVERALYPEAVYALVTLQDRQNPELRAFRIVEGTITELKVVRT